MFKNKVYRANKATKQQQQPISKQDYFDNCHRNYSCIHCRAHLANHDELISKLFQGNHGRAYLFNKVVNIGCKQAVQRELLTGLHAVADIYCDNCETTLGWKYEQAFVPSQKYKEGKYIIELVHMLKENDWDLTSYNTNEILKEAQKNSMNYEQEYNCSARISTYKALHSNKVLSGSCRINQETNQTSDIQLDDFRFSIVTEEPKTNEENNSSPTNNVESVIATQEDTKLNSTTINPNSTVILSDGIGLLERSMNELNLFISEEEATNELISLSKNSLCSTESRSEESNSSNNGDIIEGKSSPNKDSTSGSTMKTFLSNETTQDINSQDSNEKFPSNEGESIELMLSASNL